MLISILFVYLFVISSFRADHIGTDSGNYGAIMYEMYRYGVSYISDKGEYGFEILNSAALLMGNEFYFLSILTSAMLLIPAFLKCIEIMGKSNNWQMYILIFVMNPYIYMQMTFNIIRQGCATGLVLLSSNALKNKKYILYSVIIIIASTFHFSSLFLLILPFLLRINWSSNKWILFIILTCLFSYYIMPTLISYTVYLKYVERDGSTFNNPFYLIFILSYTLLLIKKYNILVSDSRYKYYVDLYLICLISLFGSVQNEMIYRIRLYLVCLSMECIPYIFDRIDSIVLNKEDRFFVRYINLFKVAHVLYYICFWCGYIILLMYNDNTAYVPYEFYWE